MESWVYWAALHNLPGVIPRVMRQAVAVWGSPAQAWYAPETELRLSGVFKEEAINALIKLREREGHLELLRQRLKEQRINVITMDSIQYPFLLKQIYLPPPVLYWKRDGNSFPSMEPAVAVVGTRNCTPYGLKAASRLSAELAEAGVWVISGMARGIDTAAHRGALAAGGKTAAVLGCGPDIVYPRENRDLYQKICSSGGILSEYPPGTHPRPQHFPARNRIISGLCQAVVVVEAGEKSGALITADFALEHGRDVLTVPGPITSPCSMGTNQLIRQGAKPVLRVDDILEELAQDFSRTSPGKETGSTIEVLSHVEQAVLAKLGDVPVNFEELIDLTGCKAQDLMVVLMQLELKGRVRQMTGRNYVAI